MGTITGIFDGAKDNIRQGKTSIRRSVSGLGSYEISTGQESFNKEGSVYGKNWSSDLNNSDFDRLGDVYKAEGTIGQDRPANINVSWNFSEQQVGLELGADGTWAAEGTVETEPDPGDGSWLKNNPFD